MLVFSFSLGIAWNIVEVQCVSVYWLMKVSVNKLMKVFFRHCIYESWSYQVERLLQCSCRYLLSEMKSKWVPICVKCAKYQQKYDNSAKTIEFYSNDTFNHVMLAINLIHFYTPSIYIICHQCHHKNMLIMIMKSFCNVQYPIVTMAGIAPFCSYIYINEHC